MHSIHASDLHRLQQHHTVQLVDVRSPAEFARGHVPGAVNIPLDRLSRAALGTFDVQRPIHLVCKSGARSLMGLQRLHAEGLQHLVNVAGGTDGWVAMGLPVEQEVHAGQGGVSAASSR
jgi:rhodanese-related sulfurtransferase